MNITLFLHFGINTTMPVDAVAGHLSQELSIPVALRTNSYSGNYCTIEVPVGNVVISSNQEETAEDQWVFPQRRDLNCIVIVNTLKGKRRDRLEFAGKMETLLKRIGFECLRRSEVETL